MTPRDPYTVALALPSLALPAMASTGAGVAAGAVVGAPSSSAYYASPYAPVLVYPGSFNPLHIGHVQARRDSHDATIDNLARRDTTRPIAPSRRVCEENRGTTVA